MGVSLAKSNIRNFTVLPAVWWFCLGDRDAPPLCPTLTIANFCRQLWCGAKGWGMMMVVQFGPIALVDPRIKSSGNLPRFAPIFGHIDIS
jgi:hypothetical protein